MSDTTRSTPACDLSGIREAVCVHTDKITDSCLAKDCIEDLHVYLTVESQCTLDKAVSAKARFVELMHVAIQLDPVPYSAGYYTVDITYYYRVIADAVMQAGRPCTITGLAVFSKRLVLFGGETTARIYSSRSYKNCLCKKGLQEASAPEAIVEIVDPMILGSRVQEVCACNCCATDTPQIPQGILDCFEEELVLGGECKRLLVTIGQFSIARLERGTQLLIPTFDYCIPTKSCPNVSGTSDENPCEVFSQIDFPMDAFFPARTIPASRPRKAAPRAAGRQANNERECRPALPFCYRIPFLRSTAHISPTRASHELFLPASMRSCVRSGCVSSSAASHAASKRFASSAMWMISENCST